MADLRTLTIHDIRQAKKLSDAEKWNQTEKDWELIISKPGNVCLAAETNGKIIGTAAAMNYENEVAWIGMVLVDREFRGQGISKLLLTGLLEQLKSCRSVKLDATPAGQKVYPKFGFREEYLIHRMTIESVETATLKAECDGSLEPLQPDDIPEVIEYDRRVFGTDRKFLLEFLVENYPEYAWVLKREGRINGFALGRKGTRFNQVGPVMASTTEEATKLMLKLLICLEGKPVVTDILDDKRDLTEWLYAAGFVKQRHFIRMYRNENPFPGIPENQFLICGPELG
ncbi:GNAT family N-acetyltransferase [Mariniphaga sediminis]|uniref:GNAT family N-acetyltransferase n=1 Tax=Mariniphaga sediminis TaxID=1628158 RepID=UPI0015588E97|nr:GNAT family N-acetyltransferase [Mariniphaga sediminis]